MRWLAMLLAVTVVLPPQPTPQWRASDQFGRALRSEEFAGAPVLVIGGGSAAAPTFDRWIDAVAKAYGVPADSLPFRILGIADVGGAPRVLGPLIRRRLPRDRTRPVLVDFGGVVAKHYQLDAATSNQLVIGRDGAVLHRSTGVSVDPGTATAIAAMLRRASAGDAARTPEPR
jgi:hypothetical protein